VSFVIVIILAIGSKAFRDSIFGIYQVLIFFSDRSFVKIITEKMEKGEKK
jgi:hypothetical protein